MHDIVEAAAALRATIRGYQDEIERERRLPGALVEQLRAADLYHMTLPRELGGLQLDLLTVFRVIELLSEGDGSVGWNVATNAAAQMVTLSLPDAGVREVFGSDRLPIVAGTVVPGGGRGVPVEGGYLISGRWPFGSGCRECDWMLGTFEVAASHERRRAVFHSAECSVIDTWEVTGLQGTGSHDWVVEDVFVPEHRTVQHVGSPVSNLWSRWSGTLYALPAHAVIGPHHSPVATGVARAAINVLTDLAGCKVPRSRTALLRDQPHVQEAVARAEALLGAARAYQSAVTSEVWDTVAAGDKPSLEQQAHCRLAAAHAVDSALQATDLMYRIGGTTSIRYTHPLARCWRDAHAVGQTASISPEWYSLTGRVFLGLDPGPRLA
ncbi:MAG TPA: acyl-CoA dehydrogenase family protein [Chloroflexota bacterium]|nr:acyl-CoA dehydrogenase family protein [Chloroflexota bacterium]